MTAQAGFLCMYLAYLINLRGEKKREKRRKEEEEKRREKEKKRKRREDDQVILAISCSLHYYLPSVLHFISA